MSLTQQEASTGTELITTEELWNIYDADRTNIETRNMLVEKYLPLVQYNAERITARLPTEHQMQLGDLCDAGVFGLIDAISAFDRTRGVQFETYCVPRIRGAMLDELRNEDWVPRLVRSKGTRLRDAMAALTRGGIPPSDTDLIQYLGLRDEDDLEEMRKGGSPPKIFSLQKVVFDTDSGKVVDHQSLFADPNAEDPSQRTENKEFLSQILRGCSREERIIMILYYYEDKVMRDIGDELGIVESRVSQMHSSLIERMQSKFLLDGEDVEERNSTYRAESDFVALLRQQGMPHIPDETEFSSNGQIGNGALYRRRNMLAMTLIRRQHLERVRENARKAFAKEPPKKEPVQVPF